MPATHPMDPHARAYVNKLDELNNLNRDLLKMQPLIDRKAKLEEELAGLRALVVNPPAPEAEKPQS